MSFVWKILLFDVRCEVTDRYSAIFIQTHTSTPPLVFAFRDCRSVERLGVRLICGEVERPRPRHRPRAAGPRGLHRR